MSVFCRRACVRFIGDESGASSVDYVTITAICLAIVFAASSVISSGVEALVTDTADVLETLDPPEGFFRPVLATGFARAD